MKTPPTSLVRRNDTHRLISSKFSDDGKGALARIADDETDLDRLLDLDSATDDRRLAENGRLPGIGIHELVFGVPYFRIVNAAFCHAHPLGSRFNGPHRGVWYAGFELKTAQAEVAFHKSVELAETSWFDEEITYHDYLADFSAVFHDIRNDDSFAQCLRPDSYLASQELAQELLDAGSLGVVYPSVRRPNGTCLACFRPALVMNVRKHNTYRFAWRGTPTPEVSRA